MSKQIGTGVVIQGAPKFTNFIVVDGTWKEKDSTDMLRTMDGDSLVANYTFWKPGADCSCDVMIKAGEDRLIKGDVLSALAPDSRAFVVVDVDTSSFGGMPLKQALQLAYHEGFTPTVVEEE